MGRIDGAAENGAAENEAADRIEAGRRIEENARNRRAAAAAKAADDGREESARKRLRDDWMDEYAESERPLPNQDQRTVGDGQDPVLNPDEQYLWTGTGWTPAWLAPPGSTSVRPGD